MGISFGTVATNIDFGDFPYILNGTSDGEEFRLGVDSTNVNRITIREVAHVGFWDYSIDKSLLPNLQFNLLDGSDVLGIYGTNGNPIPSGGLFYDGGPGRDVISINNGSLTVSEDLASHHFEVFAANNSNATFNASQHLETLSIGQASTVQLAPSGSRVIHLQKAYYPSGDSTLDLTDNAMIVDESQFTPVGFYTQSMCQGLTTSLGIRSSSNIPGRRLGVILNTDPIRTSFAGESGLVGNEILFLYTLVGDLNLDKTVSISDFIDLASNFNKNGTWRDGDLNYDGLITIADFIDLASNFNQSFATSSDPIVMPQAASDTSITRLPSKQHHHHQLVVSSMHVHLGSDGSSIAALHHLHSPKKLKHHQKHYHHRHHLL